LATYVMDMAEEDAAALATSIVFDPDWGEMDRFVAEHEDEDGYFRSPDDDNTNNFEHMRIARLWADDVVDEPAANPDGLFRKGHEIAEEADKLCEFALGLSSHRPVLKHLSVDAERITEYAARFLESHQLELRKKEMTTTNAHPTAPVALTKESLDATLEEFGAKLLSDVDAKLAALKPGDSKPEPAVEKPGGEILSQTSLDATLDKFSENLLSKVDGKLSLAMSTLMVNGNQLSKDSGQAGSDPDAKYKAEYNSQLAAFAQMGMSLDEYVTSRKIDEGKELLAPKSAAAA